MKKFFIHFLVIIFTVMIVILILNINVTIQQGINYQWRTIKLPLYLKILDFFDRHYNYRQLVKIIIKDAESDKERVMKILGWTHSNIKRLPEGFPIIDDHVWHIIVRGYGATDQFHDAFTVLCNYARLKAFYSMIYRQDRTAGIYFSFVKLDRKWSLFDPYNGVYFKNKLGDLATLNEIRSGNWYIVNMGIEKKNESDYKDFIDNLPNNIEEVGLNRANIQSPFRRFVFELNKSRKH